MKEFNACSINTDLVEGEGNYFIHQNDFYIETDDNDIVKVFENRQGNKKHVNSIGFKLSDTDKRVLHNGPFVVKSIDSKLASGMTTIELLRSSWN